MFYTAKGASGARLGARPNRRLRHPASRNAPGCFAKVSQTVGSWRRFGFRTSNNKLRLACHASASITGCVLGLLLRLRAKTSPLVRPRASRPPLYSLLCSLVNRLIAHASLPLRFMIERRFRHTSTRGSVAPRRTSNRRFTGDCIHPSLLRRGATEPPDSHSPLYTFYMFYTAIPSAPLRLRVT